MDTENLFKLLDQFNIETPSWGYADTGTRFGKFLQPAAASTIEEKLADAGTVHRYTGCCPTVAVHVLWDFSMGVDATATASVAAKHGVRIGSINPNLFQDQVYKFGSVCNPDESVREHAHRHLMDCIAIAKAVKSDLLSLWFADGTNYPGQDDIVERKQRMHGALRQWHDAMPRGMTMLVEYKPFEPAFYHTDIADWGMSSHLARQAGPQARVLVDTGHHYSAQNIEQIVAWLLHTGMLGGFHFNDRRYADDDLTLGSIDPYQIFRIFHEIHAASDDDLKIDIAYMIDQSHNLKGKMEAMVQTVVTAQELYLKAALIDREKLAELQQNCDLVGAEELYRGAFWYDVRPLTRAWREAHGLPADALEALRASGYVERAAEERGSRSSAVSSYA